MTNNNEKLIIQRDDNGVVKLILNRPNARNALDKDLINQLSDTLETLQKENIRVLQLRANGDHFSAGADLTWMQKAQNLSLEENYDDALNLAKMLKSIYYFHAPVITVVKGLAYGGALGIIAASDIVIASESSKFCFSEVRLGLIPAVISPYIVRAIGANQTQKFFLTAEVFNANQGKNMGLLHDICSIETMEKTVLEVTKNILASAPKAQNEVKKLIRDITNQNIDDQLVRITAKRIADIRITNEAKEGLAAFLEKRDPEWRQS